MSGAPRALARAHVTPLSALLILLVALLVEGTPPTATAATGRPRATTPVRRRRGAAPHRPAGLHPGRTRARQHRGDGDGAAEAPGGGAPTSSVRHQGRWSAGRHRAHRRGRPGDVHRPDHGRRPPGDVPRPGGGVPRPGRRALGPGEGERVGQPRVRRRLRRRGARAGLGAPDPVPQPLGRPRVLEGRPVSRGRRAGAPLRLSVACPTPSSRPRPARRTTTHGPHRRAPTPTASTGTSRRRTAFDFQYGVAAARIRFQRQPRPARAPSGCSRAGSSRPAPTPWGAEIDVVEWYGAAPRPGADAEHGAPPRSPAATS